MPSDRLIHRRASRSQKVTQLTDLEFRVWIQYLLSADDFGVMLASPAPLQTDNKHLSRRTATVVGRCVRQLVDLKLVRTFVHEGQPYLYQPDWQNWQRVTWPSRTLNPVIPLEIQALFCTPQMRHLCMVHPGGKKTTRFDEWVDWVPSDPISAEVIENTADESRESPDVLSEKLQEDIQEFSGSTSGESPEDLQAPARARGVAVSRKPLAIRDQYSGADAATCERTDAPLGQTAQALAKDPAPNGNYRVISKLGGELLEQGWWDFEGQRFPIETEQDLVNALKDECGRLKISRDGDVIHAAAASEWTKRALGLRRQD